MKEQECCGAGHWIGFLQAVATPHSSLCVQKLTGKDLRAELAASAEQVAALQTASASSMPEAPPQPSQLQLVRRPKPAPGSDLVVKPRAKGRPRKDEAPGSRFNLRAFLSEHRNDIYKETATSFTSVVCYRCLECDRDIKFVRNTDIEKLHQHERGKVHQNGLRRMGFAETEELQPLEDAMAQPRGTCAGLRPEDARCPLSPMKTAFADGQLLACRARCLASMRLLIESGNSSPQV